MDGNKHRSNDQELSIEELEAIFSGPSLADSVDSEADSPELTKLTQEILSQWAATKEVPDASNPEPSRLSAQPELSESTQSKPPGTFLKAQLNLMASGASDVAARRTYKSEYEVSNFTAASEKKAQIQAVSTAPPEDEEVPPLDPHSPEALRERIRAYQEKSREKNLVAQSLGIVFSFGFTVAAVILAFWYLGQRAVEYSGLAWLAYPFIIFGVLLGLYSGALVLKPFLKGALSTAQSAQDKAKKPSPTAVSAAKSQAEASSADNDEGKK